MITEGPLLVEITEGIATLTLNRPDALNALNGALRRALVAALATCDARDDVKVVILTGKGRAFCAGLDIKELAASTDDVTANVGDTDIGAVLAGLGVPVIAAINGLAVTGGFEITLACDMALAAESAWFRDSHVEIGLLPGWGLSQRLPRLVGPGRAKEISLSARKVPAAEAAALGIVLRIVPDAELAHAARALARRIAGWDRTHLRRIKALIDEGYALPFGEALALEARRSSAGNAEITLSARP